MNSHKLNSTLLSMILTLIFATILPSFAGSQVVVVVGSNSPLETVSAVEIRRCWLDKSNEMGGIKVNPIETKDAIQAKGEFCKEFLGKTAKQIKKYFIKEALKGGANAPSKMTNLDELLKELSTNPAAFSFLDRDVADKLGPEKVKILIVKSS